MRTASKIIRRSYGAGSGFPKYGDAFGLLKKYRDAKYDWTAANPISGPSQSVVDFYKNVATDLDILRKEEVNELGSPELTREIVNYFNRQGMKAKESNIVVDFGIFPIIDRIYKSWQLKERAKAVMIPTPSFGYYQLQCHNMGIKSVPFPTFKENNWDIDPYRLDDSLRGNSDVEVLLLNYPNNPTGKVLSRDKMKQVVEVLKNHPHVRIISDEIFIDMSMREENQALSFGYMHEISDRLVVLNGVSKSRGLGGLRISFACIQNEALQIGETMARPMAHACLSAAISLEDSEENKEYLEVNRLKYLENIEKIQEQLKVVNQRFSNACGVEYEEFAKPYNIPEAGNVMLLDFSGLKGRQIVEGSSLLRGYDVAKFIYEKAGVAMVPGECSFIDENEMTLRISLSHSHEELEKGFEAIGTAICNNIVRAPSKSSNILEYQNILDSENKDKDIDGGRK